MFARVLTLQAPAGELPLARFRRVHDEVLPDIRLLPGLERACWLANRQRGEILAVFLYESAAAAEQAEARARDLRRSALEMAGLQLLSVDEYEVLADI